MIKVVATTKGFYGGKVRYADGAPFHIANEAELSKRWMAVEGTPEYDAIVSGSGPVPAPRDVREINAERIAAGGVAEQLVVVTEENRALKAKVASLESELAVLRERADAGQPVQAPTPAATEDDGDGDGDGDDDGEGEDAPVRRRRTRRQ